MSSGSALGSGTVDSNPTTDGSVPLGENVVGLRLPAKSTSTVRRLPFGSVVNNGLVPVLSNSEKVNVLPEVDVKFGAVMAAPSKNTTKSIPESKSNASK